ncbi:uncharacterized protein LOC115631838 [Scaptodrosophila lebanonensis]|uniref:Uncharacterized protein LOC115631838 n=1 Tax=Drosophila lebanonensis TaxID=7225 RepID=A0A6J2U969_DROLE|nr:uncharacterized protein LOC115631838 [Scaptodrosophila lebanonensis]
MWVTSQSVVKTFYLFGWLALLGNVACVHKHKGRTSVLGHAEAIVSHFRDGYDGFRGYFQLLIGPEYKNEKIFNLLYFRTDEVFGYVGLLNYNNSRVFDAHFSVWNVNSATPGKGFGCVEFNNGDADRGYKCVKESFPLIRNHIYFVDVEITESSIRAYITSGFESLESRESFHIQRRLIGSMSYCKGMQNLRPLGYYVHNIRDRDSCDVANSLVAVNFAPMQFVQNDFVKHTTLGNAHVFNSKCKDPFVLIAVAEDKKSVIYFTRPSFVYT